MNIPGTGPGVTSQNARRRRAQGMPQDLMNQTKQLQMQMSFNPQYLTFSRRW